MLKGLSSLLLCGMDFWLDELKPPRPLGTGSKRVLLLIILMFLPGGWAVCNVCNGAPTSLGCSGDPATCPSMPALCLWIGNRFPTIKGIELSMNRIGWQGWKILSHYLHSHSAFHNVTMLDIHHNKQPGCAANVRLLWTRSI